ncbi:protein NRT1/ PTR FAMILY 5.6-like [Vigna radiata var. radiata]|uniref:Protein NRT1/ PTR FAMILY 5.6-like n=1 Tax=Vigna radiata var. radiata TaxID=3916 RepID=A0A1S3TMU0_VIGRR|nr:protein NRT1/ PTR FAMILY 5.6-like [Vigna radiata var. radiata]
MVQEMKRNGHKSEEKEEQKWVLDDSVDYKGRVPLRAATGVWKASLFVLAVSTSERITYFGLSGNLIMYLTRVIHQDLKTATNNVNYWKGATTLLPLIGGYVGDAYTGRFRMILFSSLLYIKGLIMLTMTQFVPSLKPLNNDISDQTNKVHEVVFYLGLYSLALGTGGFRPCSISFGADQFDDEHLEERKEKMSFFNWMTFSFSFALLLGTTVIVYVQDFVSWGVACLALAIVMALTTIAFYFGIPLYRYKMKPKENPLLPILQVLIAAVRKRNLSCPSNPALLFEVPESENSQRRLLSHTSRFRFLDKAAIVEEKYTEEKENPWRLATVTRVEETKLILNVVPIWLTTALVGVSVAYGSTLFVKQSAAMNLKISNSFEIPPASMLSLTGFVTMVFVPIYDKIIVPILRKVTGNERGISILRRIGIGLTLLIIVMAYAALVETKRLRMVGDEVVTEEGTKQESMSLMWMIPQFIIIGIGNAFYLTGLQEYFYEEVPDSMRSIGMALYLSGMGVGFFFSSFLLIIVDYVTGKIGKTWIAKDVNSSRLDKLYWLMVGLNILNLVFFVFIAMRYTYKTVHKKATDDGSNADGVETLP